MTPLEQLKKMAGMTTEEIRDEYPDFSQNDADQLVAKHLNIPLREWLEQKVEFQPLRVHSTCPDQFRRSSLASR